MAPSLERALLAAWLSGAVADDALEAVSLSPDSREAVALVRGAPRPISPEGLRLALLEGAGWSPERVERFVAEVGEGLAQGPVAAAVLERLRQRCTLLRLSQEVARQLQTGVYDLGRLARAAQHASAEPAEPMRSLAECLAQDGQPKEPTLSWGVEALDTLTGGPSGLTVVVGAPGVGKSDLVLQAAVLAQREMAVLYYDLDNGYPTLASKLRRLVGEREDLLPKATAKIFLRGVESLGPDTDAVSPPALIVLDLLQNVPVQPREDHWLGLQRWIYHLKELRRRGYVVLVVSEANRVHYERAALAAGRGSGAIESAASVVIQLTADGPEAAYATVLKHRHRPVQGQRVRLVRPVPGAGGLWR
ncbi:MAG: hypothetical protein QN130_12375 [Armatimonadota bacterium]|nr:hypothetical protein [Armatimonadota bacterium]